ncbi:expressed unknown protein (Partial), partial [Seminavis robusta]|eukprot:Sro113_g055890.1 n/a (382) ;mRNA; r:2-1147
MNTTTNQSETNPPESNTFALFMIRGRCRNCPLSINGVFNLFNTTGGQQTERRATSMHRTEALWRRNLEENLNTCICPQGLEPGLEPAVTVEEFIERFVTQINDAKSDGSVISVDDVITIIEVSSWDGRTTTLDDFTLPPVVPTTQEPTVAVSMVPGQTPHPSSEQSNNPGFETPPGIASFNPGSTPAPQACASEVVLLEENWEKALSSNGESVTKIVAVRMSSSLEPALPTRVQVRFILYVIEEWMAGDRFYVDIMGSTTYFENLEQTNSSGSLNVVGGTGITWEMEQVSLGVGGESESVHFTVPPRLVSSGSLSLEFGMVSSTTSSAIAGVNSLVVTAFYNCTIDDHVGDSLEQNLTAVPRTAEPATMPSPIPTREPTSIP